MPRFYFDIVDGALTVDDVGTEFADAHEAREQAIRTLPNVAGDTIGNGGREVLVLMRDEAGKAIFVASLTLAAKWLVEDI